MDAPGAASIIVRFFTDSEMKELTFPYCLYNGSVYATDAECVLLFEDYFSNNSQAKEPNEIAADERVVSLGTVSADTSLIAECVN